ncbi:hypothetical protein SPFM12_00216 [Salmonella phage SPFM12]|nr:hypothetical protein SPFM12_00216 [Salmonella phage SPFM12]
MADLTRDQLREIAQRLIPNTNTYPQAGYELGLKLGFGAPYASLELTMVKIADALLSVVDYDNAAVRYNYQIVNQPIPDHPFGSYSAESFNVLGRRMESIRQNFATGFTERKDLWEKANYDYNELKNIHPSQATQIFDRMDYPQLNINGVVFTLYSIAGAILQWVRMWELHLQGDDSLLPFRENSEEPTNFYLSHDAVTPMFDGRGFMAAGFFVSECSVRF